MQDSYTDIANPHRGIYLSDLQAKQKSLLIKSQSSVAYANGKEWKEKRDPGHIENDAQNDGRAGDAT